VNREQRLIVFVALLASLLEIVDSSIVNVAIPSMMGNLGATLEDISMVVTGYAIANAIVLPVSAWLGERFGRRQYYLTCIGLFTATSVACGLAPNLPTLIVFRIFQGLAGGALLPTSQALIYEQFPKEKAGMAGAMFGMSVMVGPTLGPVLGGYLTDQLGWRSIFNVNLPLGIFALFLGFMVIKNTDKPKHFDAQGKEIVEKKPIDAWGLFLIALGVGALQYLLERGEADDWFSSNAIIFCTIAATVCLPLFVWWELKVEDPIINVRLFKDRIVSCGTLLMAMVGFFLYAVVFILPIFVTSTLHYDATQTGILFIPGALVTVFMMPIVGKAMSKVDSRLLIMIGLFGVEATLLVLAQLSTLAGEHEVLTGLYVRGFAMAFLFVPINSSILSQFKGVNLGQVSGLLNLFRQIGGGIGIALVGTLLSMQSQQNYVDISSKVSLLDQPTQIQLQQIQSGLRTKLPDEVGQSTARDAAMKSIAGRIQGQVFMLSFNQLMYTIAIIFLFAFIPLSLIRFRNRPIAVSDAH
jgi:DHA2 family multidrug resistance protein